MVSHATSAAGSDFAPPTLTRMTRAQLSHMDLASFNDRFGSLTVGGGRRGVRMLREESGFDLAMAAEEDEVF